MQKIVAIVIGLILLISLSGVAFYVLNQEDDDDDPVPDDGPFTFNETIPETTFYHFDGGVNAIGAGSNYTDELIFDNVPFLAKGTYYSIGTDTFEPTIGVTSTGSLFMTSHKSAPVGTQIWRSQDQGMTWENVTPDPNVPNSNDPYLYVDPWTDRLVKFDMHALLGMTVEISDDEGESWAFYEHSLAGGYTPQDHQTIASMPPPPGFVSIYETVYVFSINTGLQGGGVGGSYGCTSIDGGQTWGPEVPHFGPSDGPGSGLSGHLVGANDGKIYRGQMTGQNEPGMYRSDDGGLLWSEHPIASSQIGSATHEVAIGTDQGNNVHAFWIGSDNLPYYSGSQDFGETWREPIMAAPPGVISTGFPTCVAGEDGRVAFSYVGNTPGLDAHWSGYLGVITDAWADNPLITTVAVNDRDNPLGTFEGDVLPTRYGGFGDFIDICIDPDGRPWAALSHNPSGDTGIVGTYVSGPALFGELEYLEPIPPGEKLS